MAAGVLSAPGTGPGPCVGACEHLDCRETRAWAAAPCVTCGKPIGYGTPFYRVANAPLVLEHAACAETAADLDEGGKS